MCNTVPSLPLLLHSSANKCITKVAHMRAQLQQFQRAAELFEEVRRLMHSNSRIYTSTTKKISKKIKKMYVGMVETNKLNKQGKDCIR